MARATGANLLDTRRSASSFSASPSANPVGVRKSFAVTPPTSDPAVRDRIRGRRCVALPGAPPRRPQAPAAAPRTCRRRRPPSGRRSSSGMAIPPAERPGAREEGHRRRQPDRRQALRLRRRAQALLDGQVSQTPQLDRGYDCSGTVSIALFGGRFLKQPARLRQLHELGRGRQGPLDHRLHEPRPRLRGDRRSAARHRAAAIAALPGSAPGQRPALAQVQPSPRASPPATPRASRAAALAAASAA